MPNTHYDSRNVSRMSLAPSEMGVNRTSQYGGSQFFSPDDMVGLPSDDALLAEIRDILRTADLMTVTKKGVKQELERRFGVPLDVKRQYIGTGKCPLSSHLPLPRITNRSFSYRGPSFWQSVVVGMI
jgi:chitin synthase